MSHAHPKSISTEGASPPARSANVIVAVLAFGGIVVALMQTLVIPIVPELPKLLNAEASDTAWAVTATLLAGAVATPIMGRLGDMFGKRRMLLVSLLVLVAGSVIAALSDSVLPLIVGRALQGLAAGVIPLGISIMRDELPAERLGSAMALMSASLGVGGALGLPAAAIIADNFDWHLLFWTSGGMGLIALLLVFFLVPESKVRTGGNFDFPGAVGLAIGLVSLLLPISKGADWGWGSGTTLGLFAVSAVSLLVWGWWELRASSPLVDLRTTARRQVLVTNISSVALGIGLFSMSLCIPQLLQLPVATGYGLGKSLLVAGLVMTPSGLVMMASAPVSARLSKAKGPKTTLIVGALIVAAGYGINLLLMSELWEFILVTSIIGAGIGFTYGAMPALIMGAVPQSQSGAANSLNTLFRSIGTSTASAVAGVVLAQMTTTLGTATLPSENAFKTVLAIGGGAALLAAGIATFIPRHKPAGSAAAAAATAEPVPAADTAPAAVPASAPAALPTAATAAADTTVEAPEALDGIRVHGHVRGAESAPVVGAAVTLISLGGRQLGRATTAADGAYAVSAPSEGTYVLIASADGCQPQATTVVVADAPVSYDVLLTGTSGLVGVVRSADSGAPVGSAVVILTDVRGEVLATGQTDVLGEFTVTDLAPGQVTLAVNSPKHRPLAVTVEIGGAGVTRVDVELRPGAHVRGTVRAPGGPLPDALVTLVDAAGNVVGTATTGHDGAYAFSDLDTGEYTVIATGYPPRAAGVTIHSGGLDEHDIELAHVAE
ncbi:major facilitator superfamily MFS_1 [Actinobacteria bacterium OK074]|nr:major facilitator superfamily MFS_1 [Actinobacteria bacterium OK074]